MLKGNRGEHAGFAFITGECDYDKEKSDGYFDEAYATIRIKSILLIVGTKQADGTLAYHIDKAMLGSYSDAIEDAVFSYMETELYVPETDQYEPYPDDGSTDAERNPSIHRPY